MNEHLKSVLPEIQKSLSLALSDTEWLTPESTLDASSERGTRGQQIKTKTGDFVTLSHSQYVPLRERGDLVQFTHAFRGLLKGVANEAKKVEGRPVIATRLASLDGHEAVKDNAVVTDPVTGISFDVWDYGHQESGSLRYAVCIAYGVSSAQP